MPVFKYGQKEIEYLKNRDKMLGAAIDRIGMIKRDIIPDPFVALISSIVNQQISKRAAQAVWNRLSNMLGDITPQRIVKEEFNNIKSCGLSQRKTCYIMGIAEAALSGRIDFNSFDCLTDEEIIKELSSLYGVGVWTAEMLLIFSLCRPDVVSYNDLAIRRGMMVLYGIKELSRDKFQDYRKRYSPYGSVASLYLWALSIT